MLTNDQLNAREVALLELAKRLPTSTCHLNRFSGCQWAYSLDLPRDWLWAWTNYPVKDGEHDTVIGFVTLLVAVNNNPKTPEAYIGLHDGEKDVTADNTGLVDNLTWDLNKWLGCDW